MNQTSKMDRISIDKDGEMKINLLVGHNTSNSIRDKFHSFYVYQFKQSKIVLESSG